MCSMHQLVKNILENAITKTFFHENYTLSIDTLC